MTDTATPTPTTAFDPASVSGAVDAYLAALNETDADRRAAATAEAWTDDGTYRDPLSEVAGPEAISAMVGAIHEQFPGQTFRRTSAIDGHHDVHRFAWELADAAGAVTVGGIDIATIAPDGRLAAITAFFGPMAER